MLIKTSDHMKPDVWVDSNTGETHNDQMYDGPSAWAEECDHEASASGVLLCSITWDDMWLTAPEIRTMMAKIMDLEEAKQRGVIWQQMRVVWREDIEHHVMEVPAYRTAEEIEKERVSGKVV